MPMGPPFIYLLITDLTSFPFRPIKKGYNIQKTLFRNSTPLTKLTPQPSPLLPRPEDYNDRMEQRERDKKSRQIISQQGLLQDAPAEMPLFNAPIRSAQSDERIQRQLGKFDLAMPLLDKYIGVQGPSPMRPIFPGQMNAAGPGGGGYGSSNREGYSNSRGHMMMGSNSSSNYNNNNNHGASSSSAVPSAVQSSGSSGFLKPKEAPPQNGIRPYGSSSQQSSSHPGHNRPMMHDVSG